MGRAFEFRKGRKMKRWSAMAKTFTRIGKDIVMAVKEGGPNPDANSRLRAVIQNAKAANMPKDNVERAIKNASNKDTANYKEILFEGYAPHGIAILIETASDNNNRTVANIRSYFNKCNGTMGTQGSVEFMFDHTCNFRIANNGLDAEELELELIDFGAEEVFEDEDGKHYIYFGGIWGGQLQKYRNNKYDQNNEEPAADEKELGPIVARLREDMLDFDEEPKEILILDENGEVIKAGDTDRRFFEASWVHKYNGKYYFSYSTGDTHFICYAIGDNPYGPFTYQGRILNPVVGWTSHHSICEVESEWYLFYHDSSLSKGVTHLRSMKVTKIDYLEDGSIVTIDPYGIRRLFD